jgi:ribosomal protein L3 glutamine methyltransferase
MVATPTDSSNAGSGGTGRPPGPPNVAAALDQVFAVLEESDVFYGHGTDNAWDEAVQLVLSACGLPPDAGDEVLQFAVSDAAWAQALAWLDARVSQRVPLPYLLRQAWFAGYAFHCDARALVPRSPLAEVIRDDYAPWWSGTAPRRLLDLCCGGGSIGIAAALYRPGLDVVLADIDADALSLARENIDKYALGARVRTLQSDLFAALEGQRFDIILSNPPYVDAADLAAMPREYHAEPARGLGSGADGLDLARQILGRARAHLVPGGLLFLELGNSWMALDSLLERLPLTWLEFRDGGHGVLLLREEELDAVERALAGSGG